MSNEIDVWTGILTKAIDTVPGTKPDRATYLRKVISPIAGKEAAEKAVQGRPCDVLTDEQLDLLAKRTIDYHLKYATIVSAATGIPGGYAMIETISVDTAQYFAHAIALSQKLAYLYGTPDLIGEDGKITEYGVALVTTFVGVMGGASVAKGGLGKLSTEIAKQITKRLPAKALTKTWWYPICKQIGKQIGANVTKQSFAKGASKVVPVLGAATSGGLTYVLFRKEANRLRRHLAEDADVFRNYKPGSQMNDYVDYIEVDE